MAAQLLQADPLFFLQACPTAISQVSFDGWHGFKPLRMAYYTIWMPVFRLKLI
jgi:hypothetical protein